MDGERKGSRMPLALFLFVGVVKRMWLCGWKNFCGGVHFFLDFFFRKVYI
jgi:hypothetical protein